METKAATNQHATEHNLPDTITVLSRTPAALDALLRDLPDVWTRRNEGGDTWSVFDVIGHLIQGERTDWMPRAKIILQFGETRAFDPFDRLAQRRESAGKSLGQLLDEFDSLRAANLDELRTLKVTPEDLRRRGWHPALGGVTLSQLLATWAAHDFTHLHQVSKSWRTSIGRSWSVERLSGRAALRRSQLLRADPSTPAQCRPTPQSSGKPGRCARYGVRSE